ncbi:MAG: B12-binding domain-containing radical SAM protein [Promethearchaeota archaeon]
MRLKYFIPLFAFLILTIIITLFFMQNLLWTIIPSFMIFYPMPYFFGIKETMANKEVIVKIHNKSPYITPLIFFSLPTIIINLIFLLSNLIALLQFFMIFITSLLFYFLGIYLLIYDLKKQFIIELKSKQFEGIEGKMRLLLINPVNQDKIGLTINPSSTFPPLGLGIVAALTPEDFQVKLIDENFETFEYENADLVGITAFTSAANRAYEIATYYRKNNTPVIMGGIHASMMPEEALKYVDSVVIGEAESIWPTVINDFLNNDLKKRYEGVHLDLKDSVVPNREIFSEKYLFGTIQTSRGCPMDCYFCSVSAFNGRKYRQRPYEDVLDELEQMPQRMIFFVDDNILGYGKSAEERALKLFKGMVERKLNKTWFCQASLNFGSNEEVLEWAGKAGCKMVFLGLESADPEELKSMDKKLNLQLEYEKAFKNINKYGIAVLGAFIFGSDSETVESMHRKVSYILKNRVDVIQTTILTPLPGTRLFADFQKNNRLIATNFPQDWDLYDMGSLTYSIKNLENEAFLTTHRKYQKKLYSRINLYKKFLKTWINCKSIQTAMWAYSSNKNYKNVSYKRL